MSLRSLIIGALLGAAVAAGVGIAYASIPDSSGVIHACYQNVTSANKPVKLLNTSQKTTCPSGWTAVSWNQMGPTPVYVRVDATTSISANTGGTISSPSCQTGSTLIGGGYDQVPNPGAQTGNILAVSGSYPNGAMWSVDVPDNTTGSAKSLDVYGICAAS